MVLRKFLGLFMCTLILGVASFATAGVPDLGNSEAAFTSYDGVGGALTLFCLPSGNGSAFDSCQLSDGSEVDGSITITVRDGNNTVISGFPAEDMWLASADGGMVPCAGGSIADADTDADGVTDWSNALAAGGNSLANCYVIISGDQVTGGEGSSVFALHFNSADINGDGLVDLADIGLFAGTFFGPYDFTADFYADGILNLADIGRLASGVGGNCP